MYCSSAQYFTRILYFCGCTAVEHQVPRQAHLTDLMESIHPNLTVRLPSSCRDKAVLVRCRSGTVRRLAHTFSLTAMVHALHIVPAVLPTRHVLEHRFAALPSNLLNGCLSCLRFDLCPSSSSLTPECPRGSPVQDIPVPKKQQVSSCFMCSPPVSGHICYSSYCQHREIY